MSSPGLLLRLAQIHSWESTMNSSILRNGAALQLVAPNGKPTSKPDPLNEDPLPTTAPANGELPPVRTPGQWGLARRILFRLTFVYLILYMVPSLLGEARLFAMFLGQPWPWITEYVFQPYANVLMEVVGWVAEQVFHVELAVPVMNGDFTADWLLMLCHGVLAAAATAVWSLVDRNRPNYTRLYRWFRVAVCFYLASQMIVYGMVKVIPNQFGVLAPEALTTEIGYLNRMSLLWTFMAASPAYTIFAGAAEVLGGLLLTCRRTRLLGVMVTIGVMVNVVTLNFCYDVVVKLHSSHLLVITLFLAAPDLRRLFDFFVLGRTPQPSADRPLFTRPWLRRGARVLAAVMVLGFVGVNVDANLVRSQAFGHLAPKAPLHGIWNVREMVADGVVQPPLVSDQRYWQRVIFNPGAPGLYPATLRVTRLDQSQLAYVVQINTDQYTVILMKFDDPNWQATLTYREPAPGVLVLEGMLDGRRVRITFHGVDESRLPVNRPMHWIMDLR
jgi:hypothetical protein